MKFRAATGAYVVTLLLVVGLTPAVNALPLMVIAGTVSDPLSQALANVRVTDGQGHTVYTDGSGRYRIEEDALGTYTVRVSRADLIAQARNVGPTEALTPVDFTMLYLLTASVTPAAFNSVPRELSLSASSTAPATTCVTATVSPSGSVVSLTLSSMQAGLRTWTGSYLVPAGTWDGQYLITYQGAVCTGSPLLTNSTGATYTLDRVAPIVDSSTITPLDHGNTAFASQPLEARVSDEGGAGVDSTSVRFTLVDQDDTVSPPTVTTTEYSGASVSYVISSRWAKTIDVPILIGHRYHVSVRASDLAGNSTSAAHSTASSGGGFVRTTVSVQPSQASIPSTQCELSDPDLLAQKTVTCRAVPLNLDGGTVTIGTTLHAGFGYLEQRVGLETALLRGKAGGVELPPQSPYDSGDPAWGPRVLSTQFTVMDVTLAQQTVELPKVHATLGTLTAKVAAIWTEASLEMTAVSATLDAQYEIAGVPGCRDVSNATFGCSPDPIRFYFGDEEAESSLAAWRAHVTQGVVTVPPVARTVWITYTHIYARQTVCIPNLQPPRCNTYEVPHWIPLPPQGGCRDSICAPCSDGSSECFLNYLENYPAMAPNRYSTMCQYMLADCYSLDSPGLPVDRPRVQDPFGQDVETKKHRVKFFATGFDWPPGNFPVERDSLGRTLDYWHWSGGVVIITQTNRRDYENLNDATKCNHTFRGGTPPFLCYGFSDGYNIFDGVAMDIQGTWYVPNPQPPRYYYTGKVDFFADNYGCFANNPFEFAVWDDRNIRRDGAFPPDTGDAGGLETVVPANKSGAMRYYQEGQWTSVVGACMWDTYAYSVGGDIYQLPNGTNDIMDLVVQFNHAWTTHGWNWTYGCTAGTGVSCGFSASPTTSTEHFTLRGETMTVCCY